MDLPRRIVDGGAGDWERSVLSSASLDRPSPELRARLRRELGLAVGTGLAAGVVTSKSLGAVGAKWTLIGVLLGVVGAAGLAGVTGHGHASVELEKAPPQVARIAAGPASPTSLQPAASSEPAPEVVPAAASAPRTRPSRALSGAAPVVDLAEPAPEPAAPALGAATPVGSAQFGSATESELAAQLAAIRSVRAALAARQAPRALREIDAYEHAHPSGLLLVEAEVLRIDANAALGNRDAVTRLGRQFLVQHPASPYAKHVRSLLGGSENP